MAGKKRLFSGIQPSGALHIGNYFGALRQWLDMQEEFDCVFSVVDYHALTSVRDGALLREQTLEATRDLLAIGIDPNKSILFQQSRVQEHTELAWVLECLVSVSMLELGHAYKDKVAKGLEATVGLFSYPMLMAADILLYDTDVVPVGEDQRQHVEYAREAAAKFNLAYCRGEEKIPSILGQNNSYSVLARNDLFKEPKEMIPKEVAVVPGTDGKKMSKSYKNTISLFGTKDEISKAVMSIVTDSSGERPENVYAIHKLLGLSQGELDKLYSNPAMKGKYKLLKEALVEDLEKFIAPMREKRNSITDADVKKVLEEGSEKARALASKKMADVRQKIGVSL